MPKVWSIRRFGLFLAIVPAVISLAATIAWNIMLSRAEEAAAQAEHSSRIYQGINNVISHTYALCVDVKRNSEIPHAEWVSSIGDYMSKFDALKVEIDDVAGLLKNDPEQYGWAMDVKNRFTRAMEAAVSTKTEYKSPGSGSVSKGNTMFRNSMQEIFFDPKFVNLLRIGELEKKKADQSLRQEAQFRSEAGLMLGFVSALYLSIAVAFSILFLTTIGRRLSILKENSFRLASGKELNPVITGGDELAELDAVFHNMARELNESARKEQALIENAADTICSLTSNLKINKINSAAYGLFLVDPDQLLGTNILMLVAPEQRPEARLKFKNAMEQSNTVKLELMHLRPDGTMREALWSVRWSAEEDELFCIAHDTTEQKAAARLKEDLVRMVSHDIRSPLTSIAAFIEMTDSGTFGALNETGQKLAVKAQTSTSQVLSLVSDFLELEKIGSGQLKLRIKAVTLSEAFEDAMSALAWAEKRGVSIVAEPTNLKVSADQNRLVQVLVNLLSNAVKFSERGKSVTLSTIEDGDQVEIQVRDQGRGIPEEKIAELFGKFTQVYSTDSENSKGVGLGLSICKSIVLLHGGTIGARSEQGEGSTFWIRLARSREAE